MNGAATPLSGAELIREVLRRLQDLPPDDIAAEMRQLRAELASQMGPWVVQTEGALDKAEPLAKKLLAFTQASFSAFGEADDRGLSAYRDSHWDLCRALSRDESWLANLAYKPLNENRADGLDEVLRGLLARFKKMAVGSQAPMRQQVGAAARNTTESSGEGNHGDGERALVSENARYPKSDHSHAKHDIRVALARHFRATEQLKPAALFSDVDTTSACEDPARSELTVGLAGIFHHSWRSQS
ncbi:MAG: hypothetical protein JXA69_13725 [Phycisphaerae bacterium]|nr:hypothetical protein [Phycisphaerae bacterium]